MFGGSTQNCANGIYAGYCGTQESNTGLYIAVGFGGQIIGTSVPLAFNAEFFWFKVGTVSQNYKYAEFAPGGVASNKVLADVRHQHRPGHGQRRPGPAVELQRKRLDEHLDR